MYSDKVLDHFRTPHNQGRLDDYSAIGKVGNVVCGDVMWMYIRVAPASDGGEEIIEDISWETFGCTAAIATSSMVSDLAKGKPISEAIEITNARVAEELGGLPKPKMHCSALAADALNEAIYAYFEDRDRPIPESLQKRHERILRHRQEVEQRYHAFQKPGDEDLACS
jgi:nitrogen fixation NifU-like protein